jgi:hypothetical protein
MGLDERFFTSLPSSHRNDVNFMRRRIVRLATTVLVSGGLGLAGLGLGAGTAHAFTFGPFQWCPGQPFAFDPPQQAGWPVWDMNVCHTYWYEYDVRTKAPAHYWEGENLFPTPIPPPPPQPLPPHCPLPFRVPFFVPPECGGL